MASGNATSERDLAIQKARELYQRLRDQGADFGSGPCISEEIIPGWCVDIAHDPRESIDDLPQNQCRSYREGRVRHFVELDPQGNVIRAM